MKTCKNCEWAGYCTFDENAIICEHDSSEYITVDKLQKTAKSCIDYIESENNLTIQENYNKH